jgi:K(+)-stimulated pyrophosphate-energized sodium pump
MNLTVKEEYRLYMITTVRLNTILTLLACLSIVFIPELVLASETDLIIPNLAVSFSLFGSVVTGIDILQFGILVSVLGIVFGLVEFARVKALPVHKAMAEVSALIYETCKTYMFQQGKFLIALEVIVGICMVYYFGVLRDLGTNKVALILAWSVLGILGSYSVAWFGIRLNTYANSRTAFASLTGDPYPAMEIPLRCGMSIGVLLICVELILLIAILLMVPADVAGACFIGFAIGESLGASALRICGGIFTKIADVGADLMKIVFNIKEDDARNPGVIADCTGDNAGDSVGPTADGFETYGVTAVALISFILLAVGMTKDASGALVAGAGAAVLQAKLIIWLFANCTFMIVTSIVSYWITNSLSKARFKGLKNFDYEIPLTNLIWICCFNSFDVHIK